MSEIRFSVKYVVCFCPEICKIIIIIPYSMTGGKNNKFSILHRLNIYSQFYSMQCLLDKVFAAPLIEASVCLTRSFIIIDSATWCQ